MQICNMHIPGDTISLFKAFIGIKALSQCNMVE